MFDPSFVESARHFLSYAYRRSPVVGLTGVRLLMDRFRLSGDEAEKLFDVIERGHRS